MEGLDASLRYQSFKAQLQYFVCQFQEIRLQSVPFLMAYRCFHYHNGKDSSGLKTDKMKVWS